MLNRNFIVVARNGVVGRVSYDPNPQRGEDGKFSIKPKTAVFPYDDTLSNDFAAQAVVTHTLTQVLEQKDQLTKGSRIAIYTHSRIANRIGERVNLLKEGITDTSEIANRLVKEWMKPEEAEVVRAFAEVLANVPEEINLQFNNIERINEMTVSDVDGKMVNPRANTLKKALAAGWALCPQEEITFETEDDASTEVAF